MSAIAALWTERELKAMDPEVYKRIEIGFAYAKTNHEMRIAREREAFNTLLRDELIRPQFDIIGKSK